MYLGGGSVCGWASTSINVFRYHALVAVVLKTAVLWLILGIFNIGIPTAAVLWLLIQFKDVKVGEKVDLWQATLCFSDLFPHATREIKKFRVNGHLNFEFESSLLNCLVRKGNMSMDMMPFAYCSVAERYRYSSLLDTDVCLQDTRTPSFHTFS